jgi:selenocysteine lyase/cysteine desulfurase
VESIKRYHLTEYPYRLEADTQNLAGIAGMFAGLSWLEEKGVENLYRHEMELFAILHEEGLSGIPGVKI